MHYAGYVYLKVLGTTILWYFPMNIYENCYCLVFLFNILCYWFQINHPTINPAIKSGSRIWNQSSGNRELELKTMLSYYH